MYKTFRFLTLMGAVFHNAEGTGAAVGGGHAPGAIDPAVVAAAAAGAAGQPPAVTAGAEPAAKVWYDDIAEAPVKELMAAKGYKTPAEVAMAYHNLNKVVSGTNGGVDAVAVYPGDNATPEQLETFYKKLGRPETPEGYTIKAADGITPDESLVKFAQTTFHQAGLSPKQAEVVSAAWDKYVGERAAADATSFAEANAAELEAYKASFKGNFDEAVAAGRRVVGALALDQATLDKVEGSIGAAAVLELFSKIGLKSGEGGFTAGGSTQGTGAGAVETMTPEAAQGEIARLQGDKDFQAKYTNKQHPEHKDALAKMEALFRRAP